MDDIASLLASRTKGQFLIANLTRSDLFTQLSSLPLEARHYLARELIETRFSYNFEDLIDALVFANTKVKGDRYLREGHQDFLGFLMQALILHIDGRQIESVHSFKKYRPSKEVVDAITKIIFFIKIQDAVQYTALYDNLAANLMAGIFYPLWIKSERISERDLIKAASFFEAHKRDSRVQNKWFYTRFGDHAPSINRLERRQHLFAKYQADAEALLSYITQQSWSNPKFLMFTAGVRVDINGRQYLVPAHVAKIVQALQSSYYRDPDITVTWLALEHEASSELSTPKLMSPALRGLYELVLERRRWVEMNIVFEPPHLEALSMRTSEKSVIPAQARSHP